MLKLYDYFRSSAAFRVRISLNLKGLSYEKVVINLVENEQKGESYLEQNPLGLVPCLITDDKHSIHQSLAIIEYLESAYPQSPKILPTNLHDLIYVKSIAYDIAMDIHPLNNLRVLRYLQDNLGVNDEKKNAWYQHWIYEGFDGLEDFLQASNKHGKFCLGDEPTIADICLVPQVFNAKRFHCNLDKYPLICKIEENCLDLKAFKDALPEHNQ